MKLSRLLERVPVYNTYQDREVCFLTDDSRKVREGCVFICVKGARFDGHDAAKEAETKGAVAVIVDHSVGCENEVVTDNTRAAYALMSAAFFDYPADKLRLVGVTGTNGKTTTTFLIREMLELFGKKVGLVGTVVTYDGKESLDSSLTTPECFALQQLFFNMVKNGCEYCVMEVSSQALAQSRVEGCRFEVAAFSNLTRDHLDYHGSFENYAAAKAKLFLQCDKAVLNADDPAYKRMIRDSACASVTYAEKSAADYRAEEITYEQRGVSYLLAHAEQKVKIHIGIPGEFSVYNSLCALSVLAELGFSLSELAEKAVLLKGVKGRIEVVPTDTDYVVIIDYAHSPDGLENILRAVRPITKGRVLTVFGCGGDRDKTKRPIMGKTAYDLSDRIYVTSDNPRTEDPDAIIRDILTGINGSDKPIYVNPSRTDAIKQALLDARAGDTVLLAGKGHETYQILGTVKIHYDEREVIHSLLEQIKTEKQMGV